MAAEEKAANTDRREGWSQQAESISPGDRRAIQTLLSALTPLSDLRDRPIPLPFAVVFLSVVLNEGQPVGSYAKDLNTRATGTRNSGSAAALPIRAMNSLRLIRLPKADSD